MRASLLCPILGLNTYTFLKFKRLITFKLSQELLLNFNF